MDITQKIPGILSSRTTYARWIHLLYPKSFEAILGYPFIRGFFKGKIDNEVFLKNLSEFREQMLSAKIDPQVIKYLEDIAHNVILISKRSIGVKDLFQVRLKSATKIPPNSHRASELNLSLILFERIVAAICKLQPNDEIAKLLADSYDAALAVCRKVTGDHERFKKVVRMANSRNLWDSFMLFIDYFVQLVQKAEQIYSGSYVGSSNKTVRGILESCPLYNLGEQNLDPKTLDYSPLKRIKGTIVVYINRTSLKGRLNRAS